ncbi:UNVERIFIED_CONTAM: hypothetical protein Slati_4227100 [Sesamum latifolium]|uniref:Uncharacterized protein n=1 Tax=Sesamum latifolium TaxID=2727402 RepID=A0AAW2TBG1_9LAMI
MKSIRWTRQLAGRELSSPRGSEVASHELAGCELTRSLGTRSLAGRWLHWQLGRWSPGHWQLVCWSPGRWLVGRRSRARQVAGCPAIYASWRRLIGLLGRKV